jgi:hypothetical protein
MSTDITDHVQQHRHTAASIANAEMTIDKINARLEMLALQQIGSQDRDSVVARTSISFSLIPLALTIEKVTINGKKGVKEAQSSEPTRTVRLPYWFLQQQYAFQLRRATAGWLFSRPVHRTVPYDCSLFEACRIGDIESIRTLLSTREASPFDRTASGATALEFAMQAGQLEVCRLLRQAGIFSQFQTVDYCRTFASLERSMSDFSDHSRSLLRTVVGNDDPDRHWFVEHCEEMYEDEGGWIRRLYADAGLFSLLLHADHKTALLQISDLRAYFEARSRNPFPHRHFLPFISRILLNTAVIQQIRLNPHKYTWLVYAIAHEIAQEQRVQDKKHQWSGDIRNILIAILDAGLVPHHTTGSLESYHLSENWYKGSTMTPLVTLCVEALRCSWPQLETQSTSRIYAHARLKAWVTGLSLGAIDLLQYAKDESSVFGCSPNMLVIPWGTDGEILISTGRDPSDWSFSFWEPCESYARVFWYLVEGTPAVPNLVEGILHSLTANRDLVCYDLPGSWPEVRSRRTRKLEEWLSRRSDDVLLNISEDLAALSSKDFLIRWQRISEVLEIGT